MLHELRLPDLGEGVSEGEVLKWLVAEGDEVEEDTPLVEVMTDKASVEIPSPVAGTVESLCVAAGTLVAVGTVLMSIRDGVAAVVAAAAQTEASAGATGRDTVSALPATRHLARELGVDIGAVPGSGPQGRVTDGDVRGAAGGDRLRADGAAEVARENDEAVPATATTRIPLRGRRRAIAERLTRAAGIPTVTFVDEAEFDRLDVLCARIETLDGARIGYLPFIVCAVARALRAVPVLNSRLDEGAGEIAVVSDVNIGIAVDTEDGLVVPVVHGADRLDVRRLAETIDALASAARAGTLTPEQLRGSTFTVSSAGRFGGLMATPILNHPEVAILGVHRARPRPVVHDGQVVVRKVGNLSLTFDHRVVDGIIAARFTQLVIDRIEEPGLLAVGPPA